jgi:predicted Zn-dependent peptidase
MESINAVTQAKLKKYIKDHYTANNTIIVVAGNFDEKEVILKLRKLFKSISCLNSKPKKPVKFIDTKQELIIKKSKFNETFLTIAFPSVAINSEKLYMAKLIGNLLVTKGLSSKLYSEIREEKGLVYRIIYSDEHSLDYGLLFITFPTSFKNIPECLNITLKELSKIKENGVDEKDFKESMLNIEGQMDLLNDNFYESIYSLANEIALTNQFIDPKEKIKKYKAITKEELDNFAKEVFDFNKMKICVDGNFKTSEMKKSLTQILNKYFK